MRKKARESAFKIIYQSMFIKDNFASEEILEEDEILDKESKGFVETLIQLYKDNAEEINNLINSKLKGYTPDRVYKIDRAILCLGVTEILYYKETPFKIVVNECVEMAKKYSTEKSYSFINGVLKAVTEGVYGN